jgi:uncharacterized protein YndB with AHSA1/START domain
MRIEHSVVITRPVHQVFGLVGNPDNDGTWGSLIVGSRMSSTGLIGVGSRFEQTATFMGAHLTAVIEITEFEPERRVSYATSHPVHIDHSRTFEDVPEGTRLTFVTEFRAHGKFRVAEALLRRGAQRQMEADMEEIKALMEGDQTAATEPA